MKAGPMLPKERISAVAKGERPDRVPFVPTIYEHAAAIGGVTPSVMARDARLIAKGQILAYELYGHDLIVVGVDIYNIEAEALGCRVRYFDDAAIPAITGPILSSGKDLAGLRLPDPERSARMPLLLDAAVRVRESLGHEVPVGMAMVGPFTLAAILRGFEELVIALVTGESWVRDLLTFTTEVCLAFGRAAAARGLGLSINESWITPPMLTPQLYTGWVFPHHQALLAGLRDAGADSVSLISGGNTTPIVDWLVKTGSTLLMADYGTDLVIYRDKAIAAGVILRGSIQARLLENGSREEIRNQALRILDICAVPGSRFVLGCGVLPYGADPARVLYLKHLAEEYAPPSDGG